VKPVLRRKGWGDVVGYVVSLLLGVALRFAARAAQIGSAKRRR
jgi:hypothetical protein